MCARAGGRAPPAAVGPQYLIYCAAHHTEAPLPLPLLQPLHFAARLGPRLRLRVGVQSRRREDTRLVW